MFTLKNLHMSTLKIEQLLIAFYATYEINYMGNHLLYQAGMGPNQATHGLSSLY